MKNLVFILIANLGLCSVVVAQEVVVTSVRDVVAEKENTFLSKGLRLGYIKPSLNWQLETPYRKKSGSIAAEMNGVTVGYVYMPFDSWGWSVNTAYIQMRSGSNITANLGRLEGNASYSLNRWAYAKAGLNGSKFLDGVAEDLDASLGAQAGLGLQLNPYVGFEMNYVFMHRRKAGLIDYVQSGLELGVNGTVFF